MSFFFKLRNTTSGKYILIAFGMYIECDKYYCYILNKKMVKTLISTYKHIVKIMLGINSRILYNVRFFHF